AESRSEGPLRAQDAADKFRECCASANTDPRRSPHLALKGANARLVILGVGCEGVDLLLDDDYPISRVGDCLVNLGEADLYVGRWLVVHRSHETPSRETHQS